MDIPRTFLTTLVTHLPYAGDGDLAPSDDLAALGLDSMGVVQLLTDLEETYGLDLPDELITEETFRTVGSLWRAVGGVLPAERFVDA